MTYPLVVYTALLILYLAIIWRSPDREPEPGDWEIEGEERFVKLATYLNLVWFLSLSLPYFTPPLAQFDPLLSTIFGLLIFFMGMTIRSTAISTLGHFFTYKLTIRREHELLTHGLYRYLRHPSYTGTLMEMVGMMLVARSWIGLLIFSCSGGLVIAIRIHREERLLLEAFGNQYKAHAERTKRLIPWIF